MREGVFEDGNEDVALPALVRGHQGLQEVGELTPPPLTTPPSPEHLSLSLILPLGPHNHPNRRAEKRIGVTLLETHAAHATCADCTERVLLVLGYCGRGNGVGNRVRGMSTDGLIMDHFMVQVLCNC